MSVTEHTTCKVKPQTQNQLCWFYIKNTFPTHFSVNHFFFFQCNDYAVHWHQMIVSHYHWLKATFLILAGLRPFYACYGLLYLKRKWEQWNSFVSLYKHGQLLWLNLTWLFGQLPLSVSWSVEAKKTLGCKDFNDLLTELSMTSFYVEKSIESHIIYYKSILLNVKFEY